MEINFINQASIKRKQETSLWKNQKIIYEKNKYLITHLKNILVKPFLIKFRTPNLNLPQHLNCEWNCKENSQSKLII